MFVVLTVRVYREDETYVSVCEELGVSSCGESVEEAYEAAKDAVALYLTTLEEVGERDRVFAERSIRVYRDPSEAPDAICVRPEIAIDSFLRIASFPVPAAA